MKRIKIKMKEQARKNGRKIRRNTYGDKTKTGRKTENKRQMKMKEKEKVASKAEEPWMILPETLDLKW